MSAVYQAIGTVQSGAGALSVPWPVVHQAGDIALLFVQTANEAITTPAGWTPVTNSPQGIGTAATAGSTRLSVFWRRAASSAEANAAVSDSGNHQYAVILTYRGCIATGDPTDVTAGGTTAATTTVTLPSVTTTVAEALIVLAVAHSTDSNNPGAFSNWANANLSGLGTTGRLDGGTVVGTGGGLSINDGTKVAAGSTGTTTATTPSSAMAFLTIALKPQPIVQNGNFFLLF